MKSTADDEVQLGPFDLPARVLAAAGLPLTELVGERGAASVSTMMGPVPVQGWRVIDGRFPPPPGELSVLAAPWEGPPWNPVDSNGWMQVSFTRRNGEWSAVLNRDRKPVRPGRRLRRAGPRLQWHSPVIAASAGSIPEVRLSLSNAASVPWQPDGIDHGYVRVWAVGADGQPLARKDWSMEALHAQPLTTLDADESLDLAGTWDTDMAALTPGDYTIEAELYDLQLRTTAGTLRLH